MIRVKRTVVTEVTMPADVFRKRLGIHRFGVLSFTVGDVSHVLDKWSDRDETNVVEFTHTRTRYEERPNK